MSRGSTTRFRSDTPKTAKAAVGQTGLMTAQGFGKTQDQRQHRLLKNRHVQAAQYASKFKTDTSRCSIL
jgi:hypothetical protein